MSKLIDWLNQFFGNFKQESTEHKHEQCSGNPNTNTKTACEELTQTPPQDWTSTGFQTTYRSSKPQLVPLPSAPHQTVQIGEIVEHYKFGFHMFPKPES